MSASNQVETEQDLQKRAIEWMEAKYRDQPSGPFVRPPSFYQCNTGNKSDSGKVPECPCMWIKDWITGNVRSPKWTDDMIAG